MLEKVPLRGFVYTAVALNLITTLTVVLFRNSLPPVVPVLFGKPTGESQLVPTLGLLIAPAVSILIVILNSTVAILSRDAFLKKILVIAAFLASILTTIAVFRVVLLV
ncbi:MAG: hypothetical protein UX13_C0005G0008 [Candidatus Woesebacteria bacterium GW2011_GWB1_45_5]|uniref:DUF1648 domain-containing protein n=1 Tax=Candidatus Woesebacteria bacterium GW2011_GWB1_45_5 TaxID=1618581 RepID=A0A0G1QQ06_9BACT|nr:MAG: hypothetical protein UX13_C0005G0008 [Candidatus Woesebacteria bacterium GW2011_GWB1_45_5]